MFSKSLVILTTFGFFNLLKMFGILKIRYSVSPFKKNTVDNVVNYINLFVNQLLKSNDD